MALNSQIGTISSVLGNAVAFANSFKQPQVSITEKKPIPGLKISVPVIGKSTVVCEIVDTEDMTMSVTITDKPVADLGAAIDYISRNPPVFILKGLFSNRNLDILADPVGFAASQAASAFPQVASTISQVSKLGGQFVDLGGDDIDNKIKQLNEWMLNAVYVYPIGVRLDINNWIQDTDLINWLIEDITPNHSLEEGDGVGYNIRFKGFLGIPPATANLHGGILQNIRKRVKSLGGLNPFGGV